MNYPTADLCDAFSDEVQIVEPIFADFGGQPEFAGPISTVKCFEDNSLVRGALEEPGQGRVLVVDGGASDRCGLLGGNLAQLAADNNWVGVLVYGCIRDAAEIAETDVGVKALAAYPKKSNKRNLGDRDVPVRFAGVNFAPGHWLYADLDGVVVSAGRLSL